MKLRFPGTGYGECKVKKKTVKEYRRPASLLIDDRLVIDPSPALFEFEETFGLDHLSAGICDVLITHSHPGHFSSDALLTLAQKHPINVYASESVIERCPVSENLHLFPMKPGELYDVSDYKVIALPAAHRTDVRREVCLHFAICRDHSLLYTVDGGGVDLDAWQILREVSFDALITECSLGLSEEPDERWLYHASLSSVATLTGIFRKAGVLKPEARVILTHLPTDKKSPLADALTEGAIAVGATAAYDGYFMTV